MTASPPCRPLLTSSYPKSPALALPYSYTPAQLKHLLTYLTPTLHLLGVDFTTQPPPDYKPPRNCAVYQNGQHQGQTVRVVAEEGWVVVEWVLGVVVGEGLRGRIREDLLLLDGQGRVLAGECRLEDLQGSTLALPPLLSLQPSQTLRVSLPVALVLPRLPGYSLQHILNMVAEDVTQAVDIMLSNGLLHRVVRRHRGVVVLQNFYKGEGDSQKVFEELVGNKAKTLQDRQIELLQKRLQKEGQVREEREQQPKVKQSKNDTLLIVGLVLVLIGLVLGYIVLKSE